MEHTLRADFFCVMQMLAKAFHVPVDLSVDEVLSWIASSESERNGRIHRFFESSVFMQGECLLLSRKFILFC